MENKKIKFYSLNKILKTNSQYYMIFGERSNGKTYSVLKHLITEYFKSGYEFAIIRRWREDIIGKRATGIFRALNDSGEIKKITKGKYEGVCYYAGHFYFYNLSEDNKITYDKENPIGYTFALSESEHNKSISYPRVQNILFDEFIASKLYLNDEFVTFCNTLSTIIRQRTGIKIFMLGNTISKFCPYFKEMGISNVFTMKQGTIDVYRYGESDLKVSVEYCTSLESQKTNNHYFAFNNPKLNMITGGGWQLDIYPHLPYKYKPKDILFTYFIKFEDNIYQCNIIQDEKGETFTFIHRKTTEIQNDDKELIYSLEYSYKLNYNRSIFKPSNKVQKKILWYFTTDRVFYQDNEIGDSISNYIKMCKGV